MNVLTVVDDVVVVVVFPWRESGRVSRMHLYCI